MKENSLLHPKCWTVPKPRALLSVSNKDGLIPLAQALIHADYEIISSGGTAKALQEHGIPVTPVEKITGNPEAFQGRMKTLSFQISSAILFDRDNASHKQEAAKLGIRPIDIVVCNFYPFEKTLKENLSLEQAIELIDIGGPTLVRAAAKNYRHVVVVVDPKDYPAIIAHLSKKEPIPLDERFKLAAKVFQKTADYDAQIETYFYKQQQENILRLRFEHGKKLRYGENPHQEGFVYQADTDDPLAFNRFKQVNGKALSFNNFLDADTAVSTLGAIGGNEPACVIVKHANPCGAALGKTVEEAFMLAWESDPVAAFGGVIAMNRPLTASLAEKFLADKKFAEIFMAPSVDAQALALLTEKKKNLMLLINEALLKPMPSSGIDIKKIRGGVLIQDKDVHALQPANLAVVSTRQPTPQEWQDLLFAWAIGKECKSNSIILVKNQQLIGAGVGQQDRVRACRLAAEKAGLRAKGAAAASDGFFPFRDGPECLIQASVTAIIHPGGSIRDADTVAACNQYNIALVATQGIRAFKH